MMLLDAEVPERKASSVVRVSVWDIAWGVLLGGCLLLACAAILYGAVWLINDAVRTSKEAAQARQEAEYEQAQRRVSPQFQTTAEKVGADIHAEYGAARSGWKTYSPLQQRVKSEVSALGAAATTSRERDIANDLDHFQYLLNDCVGSSIGPSYHLQRLSDCFSESPESSIDKLLQK